MFLLNTQSVPSETDRHGKSYLPAALLRQTGLAIKNNKFLQMKNEFYKYLILLLVILFPLTLVAGVRTEKLPATFPERTVTGRVSDSSNVPLVGVTVKVKGTSNGTVTNMSGHFTLTVSDDNAILVFTYVGYKDKEVSVNGRSEVNVTLQESAAEIGEVVVTAFGTQQKRESVVGAISTVRPEDLRVPSSNLTTAFAGRLPGVIAFQRSGEPGLDNASFFIRGITSFSAAGKKDPLILVDGVEMTANDLARINIDDIAAFTVMKDASAAALYGARGANGVILISTKEGKVDKLSVTVRAEISRSSNTELVQLADPITYMQLHNEAVRTRNPAVDPPYSLSKIRQTALGTDSILYPSVDWYDYLIANSAVNKRVNLNLTGGGQTVQYYLSANYQNDQGILKESKENLFDNNINVNRLQVRSNVTIKFAPTTTGVIRAYGSFENITGPLDGGAKVFDQARNATPVRFLPFYPPDSAYREAKHILFGMGPELNVYNNPLANVISSFRDSKSSMMLWQLEMEHRFTGALEGLSIRGLYNIMRKADYTVERGYSPFYYTPATTLDGSYRLVALNPDGGTEYLTYDEGPRSVNAAMYGELRLGYSRTFNEKHDVNVTLVGTMRNETGAAPIDDHKVSDRLQFSLPRRNISTAGRFAYGYDSRYFVEFDFGYNGSERFSKENRFGFFPAVGAGWMVSSEPFMSGVKNVISKLKLRGTYGKVGNDAIGSVYDRFFYLSQVDMTGAGYWFGVDHGYRSGITIKRYANPLITWEIAKKTDLGIDVTLFNDLDLIADFFWQTRSNILQTRADVPTTMGLRTIPQTNVGIAQTHGFESTLKYQHTFNKNIWLLVNSNFTYATGKYKKYEEPDYSDIPWKSHIGLKINQPTGYIAERLFIDEEEVNNSPVQKLSEYAAGDIKYKDINNDGLINDEDEVPIGYPTVPEIIYGAGFTFGIGAFDVSCFFQGSARSSFFIDASKITPFVNQGQRGLLQYIADDHWSENNRNLHAFWPRLSDYAVKNNTVASTYWLRNGAFLRFKTAEIGYTLPKELTNRVHVQNFRVYASGSNLFVWSKFKMWDPEMAGNGLGYPVQRVVNFGINFNF